METNQNNAEEIPANAGQQASDPVNNARERVSSAADNARQTAEEAARQASDRVQNITGRVSEEAERRGYGEAARKVESVGGQAAHTLGQASEYLGEHGSGDMLSDYMRYLRTHPTSAAITALAVGYLLGRILR